MSLSLRALTSLLLLLFAVPALAIDEDDLLPVDKAFALSAAAIGPDRIALDWSIAEGGKPFDSEMPAFRQTLRKDEIWSVAAYLRAGMPNASP